VNAACAKIFWHHSDRDRRSLDEFVPLGSATPLPPELRCERTFC
jgi:hypothetical protein